jgi:hypothetical protein
MKRNVATAPKPSEGKRQVDGTTCHHYWQIEIAKGPKSRGRCKYCGVKREFINYLSEDYCWEGRTKEKAEPILSPMRDVEISGVLMN